MPKWRYRLSAGPSAWYPTKRQAEAAANRQAKRLARKNGTASDIITLESEDEK